MTVPEIKAIHNMTTMAGMSGHGGPTCKISMLWNWHTVDACFISSSWRITSTAMFAGSCIGIILLTVALEALRRSVKEYDRFLIRRHFACHLIGSSAALRFSKEAGAAAVDSSSGSSATAAAESKEFLERHPTVPGSGSNNNNSKIHNVNENSCNSRAEAEAGGPTNSRVPPFRPSLAQQVVRAGLHTVQFAIAYLLMLLAMYYNGYFIICIFVGAFLGAMAFQWETIGNGDDGVEARASAAQEATVCCD